MHLFWIILISPLAVVDGNPLNSYEAALTSDTDVFWDSTKANGILNSATRKTLKSHARRRKRGLGSTIHGWTNGEENKERMEESMEHDRTMLDITRAVACRSKCWTLWSSWSACSAPCHGGQRQRTRQIEKPQGCEKYPCPGSNTHTQKCHVECGTGGTNRDGKCVCKEGYSGECCENSVKCLKVTKPPHGRLDGVVNWPALFKAGLVYSCYEGYVLTGGAEVRRCQLNGQWSGTGGQCSRVVCDGLPTPEHGSQIGTKLEYHSGNSVGFKCDDGHDLQGSNVRTCRADHNGVAYWSGVQPTCIERVCGDPGTPRNGAKIGDGTEFGDHVRFTCNAGYTMIGSAHRTCMHNARWNGTQPVCQQITCPPLEPPQDGTLMFEAYGGRAMGTEVTIKCQSGFELEGGSRVLECQADGRWNATVPKCEAIECPDPGHPEHGSREESGFLFGSKVVYSCFDGYVLWGSSQSQCLKSRLWSEPRPTCRACPKDHYSFRLSSGEKQCLPCPENTHTLSNASYSISQCVCNEGFGKQANGKCEEIHCPPLSAPVGGVLYECDDVVGSMCISECTNGHVLKSGASIRYCLGTGEWSGLPPVCSACPKDTFRGGPANCFPCPTNMHTEGTGSSFEQCLCDEGFRGPGGGPCLDIDECAVGTERCEDVCHNTYGGYACECVRPGVIVDVDGLSCKVENECRNLTAADAPLNGGLTCKWYTEQSSIFCRVMCNDKYELPPETNSFETCGPTTQYTWSFKKADITNTLMPCIDELFPGYRIYGETSYFVRACHNLTEPEKDEVKANFATLLNSENVCQYGRTRLCDVSDMAIICGATGRRKRSVDSNEEDEESMEISVTLKAHQTIQKSVDCSSFCPRFRLAGARCEKLCAKFYNRFLKAGMIYAQRKMKTMASRANEMLTFSAAGRQFTNPRETRVSDIVSDCPDGTVSSNGMCIPCGPGTFFSTSAPNGTAMSVCQKCPAGQFQPEYQRDQCLPCPAGTHSGEGSVDCLPCDDYHYGIGCRHECSCVNGKCNAVDGTCDCDSGWEGEQCQTDIDGCANDPCFGAVPCTDLKAPQTGFECGECPEGFLGDGIICEENI